MYLVKHAHLEARKLVVDCLLRGAVQHAGVIDDVLRRRLRRLQCSGAQRTLGDLPSGALTAGAAARGGTLAPHGIMQVVLAPLTCGLHKMHVCNGRGLACWRRMDHSVECDQLAQLQSRDQPARASHGRPAGHASTRTDRTSSSFASALPDKLPAASTAAAAACKTQSQSHIVVHMQRAARVRHSLCSCQATAC